MARRVRRKKLLIPLGSGGCTISRGDVGVAARAGYQGVRKGLGSLRESAMLALEMYR